MPGSRQMTARGQTEIVVRCRSSPPRPPPGRFYRLSWARRGACPGPPRLACSTASGDIFGDDPSPGMGLGSARALAGPPVSEAVPPGGIRAADGSHHLARLPHSTGHWRSAFSCRPRPGGCWRSRPALRRDSASDPRASGANPGNARHDDSLASPRRRDRCCAGWPSRCPPRSAGVAPGDRAAAI